MAKYCIKITILNGNDQRQRSLCHSESSDVLLFDTKEEADAYIWEDGGKKIPFYGKIGEKQELEVQEYR